MPLVLRSLIIALNVGLVGGPAFAQNGAEEPIASPPALLEAAPQAEPEVPLVPTTAPPTSEPRVSPEKVAPRQKLRAKPKLRVRVVRHNGRTLEGTLIQLADSFVTMSVGYDRLYKIAMSEIESIETWRAEERSPFYGFEELKFDGDEKRRKWTRRDPKKADRSTWRRDPNRTRYLFAPSAYTLDLGEGYFSQKQLALSEVAFAVHDDVTLLVGGVVPTWFMEDGFNMVMGMKAGLQIASNLHWAAGVYGVVVPPTALLETELFGGGGIAFTTLTWGSEHYHGSLSIGMPFVYQNESVFYDPVLVVAGNFRVARGLALVTEHWVIPSLLAQDVNSLAGLVNTAALRFIGTFAGDEWGVDLGLIRVHGLDIPVLPWFDVTYNWGA